LTVFTGPFEAEEVGQTHLLMEKREGLM